MKKFLHEKLIDLQQTKKYFRSDPINVYLFTVTIGTLEKDVKRVQS